MKSYKDLLNDVSRKSPLVRELDEKNMRALKQCILDIYRKVYEVCDQNGLCIMMAEGSCLGAVRHKGFIPWDDDMDVMMPRPDYEKFIELCEDGALGTQFEFRHPQGAQECSSQFMKVYMKDTSLTGIGDSESRFPQMVFLDIFPIEGIPSNRIKRRVKGFVANALRLIGNTVMGSGRMSTEEKAFYSLDKELYRMVHIRKLIGKSFSFASHQQWVKWFDSWVRDTDMSGLIGIPTARKLYDGETLPESVYLPPVEGEFEDMKVWLPADVHRYLENLYGDYMRIPPVEKRESHFICDIKLPKRYYTD